MKKLRVTVEGKVYEVLVEVLDEGAPASSAALSPRATAQVPAAAPAAAPAAPTVSVPAPTALRAPAGANDVTAPLSGKLVSIDVNVGQAVEEGAQVATIEAMKMNTYIFAPKSGKIAAFVASPGDGVEEGAVILRMA